MRSGIPLGRLLFQRCRRWRYWFSGSGWQARSSSAWALITRVTLAHWPHPGPRPRHRLAHPGVAVHLPVPGAPARGARGAGCGDHLDESRRHRRVGDGVPRRAPDLDTGRRTGTRCRRGAGRLRGPADHHRRGRHRRAAAARRVAQPRRGRRLPAAVLLRRRLPRDRRPTERRSPAAGGRAGHGHAVHRAPTRGRRRARSRPSCCSTPPCA